MKNNYSILLKSSLIDLIILLLICSPAIIWYYLEWKSDYRNNIFVISKDSDLIARSIFTVFIITSYILYVIKDAINISVGKRIYNVKIIDRRLETEANSIRKLVRNIPFLIIPIVEILMKLIFPSAKLGDMLMNTELVIKNQSNN